MCWNFLLLSGPPPFARRLLLGWPLPWIAGRPPARWTKRRACGRRPWLCWRRSADRRCLAGKRPWPRPKASAAPAGPGQPRSWERCAQVAPSADPGGPTVSTPGAGLRNGRIRRRRGSQGPSRLTPRPRVSDLLCFCDGRDCPSLGRCRLISPQRPPTSFSRARGRANP